MYFQPQKQGYNLFAPGYKTQGIIFFLCILGFSYFTSITIGKVFQEISVGAIGRMILYCLAVASLLSMTKNLKVGRIKRMIAFPQINSINFLFILVLLLAAAPPLINIFKLFSPLVLIVSIFVIGSAVLSIYSILNDKLFKALIIFIFNLPLLCFLEWQLGSTGSEWVISGPLVFTPTILYLMSMFFSYLLSDKKDDQIELSGLSASSLILLAAVIISVFISNNIYLSSKMALFQYFYPLIFFYLLLKALHNIDQIKALLLSLVIFGIIYSFFGFYSVLGMSVPTFDKLNLLYGETGLAQSLRIIATLLLPFATAMAISYTGVKKAGSIVAVLLNLLFVVAGFSRIALLGAVFSFMPFLEKRKIPILIIGAGLSALLFHGWFAGNVLVRFKEFDALEKLDMYYWSPMRLWGIQGAIGIFKDYPIFGIGYGMWDDYYYKYGPALYFGTGIAYIRAAHNTFLDMAVQGGIVMLAALIGFLAVFLKECLSLIFNAKDIFTKNIALGCLGFFILILVVSFAGNVFSFATLNDISIGVVFWSVVAILIALRKINKKQTEMEKSPC